MSFSWARKYELERPALGGSFFCGSFGLSAAVRSLGSTVRPQLSYWLYFVLGIHVFMSSAIDRRFCAANPHGKEHLHCSFRVYSGTLKHPSSTLQRLSPALIQPMKPHKKFAYVAQVVIAREANPPSRLAEFLLGLQKSDQTW